MDGGGAGNFAEGWVDTATLNMITTLPTFSTLAANYPDSLRFPTPLLLTGIGGQVRQAIHDGDNTCAIRISRALNLSGAPILATPGVAMLKGAPQVVPSTANHAMPSTTADLYIYRVLMMKLYLEKWYGPGQLIYSGRHPDTFAVPFRGVTQGIIVFEWQGRPRTFGATGHVDLFRLVLSPGSPPKLTPGCVGHCFFVEGPMLAYLWELRP
jgi:hypothetical protein